MSCCMGYMPPKPEMYCASLNWFIHFSVAMFLLLALVILEPHCHSSRRPYENVCWVTAWTVDVAPVQDLCKKCHLFVLKGNICFKQQPDIKAQVTFLLTLYYIRYSKLKVLTVQNIFMMCSMWVKCLCWVVLLLFCSLYCMYVFWPNYRWWWCCNVKRTFWNLFNKYEAGASSRL